MTTYEAFFQNSSVHLREEDDFREARFERCEVDIERFARVEGSYFEGCTVRWHPDALLIKCLFNTCQVNREQTDAHT